MKPINERIEFLIKKLGLKKVQFAETLNITPSYVTRLIAGKGQPSPRLIEDMARKFHVREEWLREGKGEMFAPQDETTLLDDDTLDDMDKAILKAYIAAPKELRAYLKEKIMELAKVAAAQSPAVESPAPVEEDNVDVEAAVEEYRQRLLAAKKAQPKSVA